MQCCCCYQEEYENYECWLVFYVDFIILLFVFFVVMYLIFLINEGKYKIFLEIFIGVFNQFDCLLKLIFIGDEWLCIIELECISVEEQFSDNVVSVDLLEWIVDSVCDVFGDLIVFDQLSVCGNELWIEIIFNFSLLFFSGDVLFNDVVFDIVEKVVKILVFYKNLIYVEGFIDDVLIYSLCYFINWELLVVWVVSIVCLFGNDGVELLWMVVVGYGEFQLVVDNVSVEGWVKNCWVVLVILCNLEVWCSVSGVGSGKV